MTTKERWTFCELQRQLNGALFERVVLSLKLSTPLAELHPDATAVFKDSYLVARVEEPRATRSLWLELAASPCASPNVWMDAYLAAFANALEAELVTFDRGIAPFEAKGLSLHLLESP